VVVSSRTALGMVIVIKRILVSTAAVFCNTMMRHNIARIRTAIILACFIGYLSSSVESRFLSFNVIVVIVDAFTANAIACRSLDT
jgi:hypothetical protein